MLLVSGTGEAAVLSGPRSLPLSLCPLAVHPGAVLVCPQLGRGSCGPEAGEGSGLRGV